MRELKRILYVEDDSDIQTVARFALEELGGLSVDIAASGWEALAKAPSFAPDLILLDVMMPGMDGPATFAALRLAADTAHTPIVFMTAKAQTDELARFAGMGAAGVITKPFDPMSLADRIRALWSAAMVEEAL